MSTLTSRPQRSIVAKLADLVVQGLGDAQRLQVRRHELACIGERLFAQAIRRGDPVDHAQLVGEQAAVDAVATAGYYVMLFRVSQALKD